VHSSISSRLLGEPERRDPVVLAENAGKCFQGSILNGIGFTLTPAERDALVRRDLRNAARIFPYLGGREVNTSPTQDFDRYVINFGSMSLEEAGRWPDLLAILREKVKPEREIVNREAHRRYWWHYGEKRPGLYGAIAPLPRCLVTARVTKHLVFAFQSTDRVASEQLFVFALSAHAHFAVLQSRIHEPWARLLSSSLEDRLRYAASDCFETFPFPRDVHLTPTSPVEAAGQALYEARAAYMVKTQQGLTKTYNHLKDPACVDPPVVELRRLHEAMDRAVLDAYGWGDISVPPYEVDSPVFKEEVIDRLYMLNRAYGQLQV